MDSPLHSRRPRPSQVDAHVGEQAGRQDLRRPLGACRVEGVVAIGPHPKEEPHGGLDRLPPVLGQRLGGIAVGLQLLPLPGEAGRCRRPRPAPRRCARSAGDRTRARRRTRPCAGRSPGAGQDCSRWSGGPARRRRRPRREGYRSRSGARRSGAGWPGSLRARGQEHRACDGDHAPSFSRRESLTGRWTGDVGAHWRSARCTLQKAYRVPAGRRWRDRTISPPVTLGERRRPQGPPACDPRHGGTRAHVILPVGAAVRTALDGLHRPVRRRLSPSLEEEP